MDLATTLLMSTRGQCVLDGEGDPSDLFVSV
jgi:hypothetical protein